MRHEPRETATDVIVVGNGLEGLAASACLRARGRDVALLSGWSASDETNRVASFSPYGNRWGTSAGENVPREKTEMELRPREFSRRNGRFEAVLGDGSVLSARFLILSPARSPVPNKHGFLEYYGRGVQHHWHRHPESLHGQAVVVYGGSIAAVGMAMALRDSTAYVGLCTDGVFHGGAATRAILVAAGIKLIETPVAGLQGNRDAGADRLCFVDQTYWPCRALFLPEESTLAALGLEANLGPGDWTTEMLPVGDGGIFLTVEGWKASPYAANAVADGLRAALAAERALSRVCRWRWERN